MKKVTVTNKFGSTWSMEFNTQEEVDSFINNCVQNNSWGKPERWVAEQDCSPQDILDSLSSRINSDGLISFTEYQLPVEYTIVQTDISLETQETQRVEEGKKRQELGASIIAKVYSINEAKNLDATTFANMMADTTLERIERMLWTGSLKTAKLMIQALDNTYFTNEEKQSILDMLADY